MMEFKSRIPKEERNKLVSMLYMLRGEWWGGHEVYFVMTFPSQDMNEQNDKHYKEHF